VREQYDLVWIAPDEPVRDILSIPDWDDSSLRHVWLPPMVMNATAPQFVDNFLDFGHFPFVHAGTFGAGEDASIPPYEVQTSTDGWGFVVDYHHQINNKEDPKVATGEHPLLQPRQMRYEFSAPFTVTLRLVLPVAGTVNHLINFIQPLDANRTCVYTLMLRNDCPTDELAQAAVDYEIDVLKEDLSIIEHLWDNVVPLEVGQAHTRADRNTVEFRRIMKRLLDLTQ
jgi:vanillate O-demethylase monooxygenase subunit